MSQHITALEKQIGAPLLIRHARGVCPTAAGALLARHAEQLAGRLGDAERELEELLSSASGTVRLGIIASAAVGVLPAALAAFTPGHPGVEVTVDECDVDVGADACARASSTSPCSLTTPSIQSSIAPDFI